MQERSAKDIFLDLLELEDSERDHQLDQLAQQRPTLAQEVRSLLCVRAGSTGFLRDPTTYWAAQSSIGTARLAPGTELDDRFRIEELLGEGAFG